MTWKLFADYHTHTRYSHGSGSVAANAAAADRLGLDEVAITDHGPASLGCGIRRSTILERVKADAARYNAMYPRPVVLAGVEANVIGLDGTLDVEPAQLASLDLVVAGLHPHVWARTLSDLSDLVLLNVWARWSKRGSAVQRAQRANTSALIHAVRRYDINIISHPGHQMPVDLQALAGACAAEGTALEVNANHPGIARDIVAAAAATGALVAISSDAHSPAAVGQFQPVLELVREAGLPASQIINARSE